LKNILLAVTAALAAVPGAALAQYGYGTSWEITPMAGYRTYGTLTNTDVAQYSALTFKSGFSWGGALGYNFSPISFSDVTFSYTSTDATAVGRAGVPSRTIPLKQYDTQFNIYYLFGEDRSSVRPYLGGGVGFTILAPSDPNLTDLTRFSFSVAGGVKMYFGDHFGLRIDLRWMPLYLYSTAGGTWCDAIYGCYYLSNDHMLQQGDFKGGVIFRF
jgi:outer membrane protein W